MSSILLILPISIFPASAVEIPVGDTIISDVTIIDESIMEMSESVISNLNLSYEASLELASVKKLLDFSGNIFYVIECNPYGYAIVHGTTGEVVEASIQAVSPYQGFYGALFYGGPTYYYIQNNELYSHTLFSSEYLTEAETAQAASISSTLNSQIISACASVERASPSTSTRAVNTMINGSWIIDRLDNEYDMGYMEYQDGVCGYIAAGLMLLWHRYYENAPELIDGFSYLYDDNTRFIDADFTRKLMSFGGGNLTSGDGLLAEESIQDVLDSYGDAINVNLNGKIAGWLPSKSSIVSFLRQNQQPLILFGTLNSPSICKFYVLF